MTHAFHFECVDHTSESIARLIHSVQMSAYAQEAELLGAVDFPPLSATVQDVRTCDEEFIVAYAANQIVGAVSVAPDPEFMGTNIASLVVAPPFQRRGIARRLVAEVLHRYGASTLTVQTGAKNQPALGLYLQSGFVEFRRWRVAQHSLELVKLRRLPPSTSHLPTNAA
jgi:ribosomal protein S18 acetylase RimI-like enzyme